MRGVRFDPERVEVHTLLRHAPIRGARVLEIGCGDGRLTRRIAHAARSVVGIDADGERIARAREFAARRLRQKVKYEVGSGEHLPFPDATFDIALFSWSL